MRKALAILAVAGFATGVLAQTTSNTVAIQTGTIQRTGPRTAPNGDNFLNIENNANGTFSSYGVARWDVSSLKAAFDTAYGAGAWHITTVELELTESDAAFSAPLTVDVYYSTDDTTDCKTAASPLFYPFFDPLTSAPSMSLGNGGNRLLQYQFNTTGNTHTGDIERYTQTGSLLNGAPLSGTEVLSLAPDMVSHIAAGGMLTLILVEDDPTSATLGSATYNGQVPFSGRVGPNIFVTAEPTASVCYANCDASMVPPILNANDFQCFLNKFAAADSYANCDGSTVPPILNANDFQCFLNAYAVGCT